MKILYISGAVLPSEESHSISIMRVCQAFADNGHEVTLTALAPYRDAPDPTAFYGLRGGFRVVRHFLSPIWSCQIGRLLLLAGLALAWKTRRLVTQSKPDIVFSRLTIAELAFVPSQVPIIYEMHSLGPLRGNVVRRLSFRWLIGRKNLRRIIVSTDALRDLLEEELPGMEVVVARLSAERPVPLSKREVADFRNKNLQGKEFDYHVGYTGYMDTYGLRGTDLLIRIAKRIPHAAFHLVGGRPDVVEHWRRYATAYNRHSNIFFYGYRNPSEMPLFLNCFEVVVAPLQYRPAPRAPIGQNMSPLKLPQYMAYGKSIVASDLPAHRECLVHDETALLVRSDDLDAWVTAVGFLLGHAEKRHELGQAAHAAYQAGYTPQMRVERMLEGLP